MTPVLTVTPNPAIDRTNFTIQIDWYQNGDWSWLTTPGQASGSFPARLAVPADTPYGMYEAPSSCRAAATR